jgi:membrane-associated protease RseP (regulator of RpoE activity)
VRRPPPDFKPGDVILSADGKTVDGFGDVQRIAAFNAGTRYLLWSSAVARA